MGSARAFRWEHSTSWAFTAREQEAVELVDRPGLWQLAGGGVREGAFVADTTALLGELNSRPPHHRVIARKEPLHPPLLQGRRHL